MRYHCKSSTGKDKIPFLGVEYLNLFWIASPIKRINPISFTIMAGSRDSKRFFCKVSLILDLSNTLEKELGREICQTSLNLLDPMDFPSNVPYFPRISQNSLKIPRPFEQIFKFKVLPRTTYLSKRNNLFCI